VGKADVAEIAPDLVRKGRQEGLRIWSSTPQTLVALRFDDALAAPASDQIREVLWLALDRDTMANVLLQREAQPADSLLPQWLSGYAFLFEKLDDLQAAQGVAGRFPRGSSGRDSAFAIARGRSGDLFKLIGERVAVNARQPIAGAGCHCRERGQFADGGEWIALFAWHYDSLSPHAELEVFVKQLLDSADLPANSADPEHLFRAGTTPCSKTAASCRWCSCRSMPAFEQTCTIGMHRRWGDWRLADVVA